MKVVTVLSLSIVILTLRSQGGPLTLSLCLLSPPPPTPEHEGTNPCSVNNGDCSQLCLPTSESTRSCMCTAGYSLRSGQQACEGQYSRLGPGPQPQPVLPCSPTFLSSP